MHDDRIRRSSGIFRAGQGTHLQAVPGVGQRLLKGEFRVRETLQAGAEAREVHEREHVAQALIDIPDQVTGGAVEVEFAGRVAVNAHFSFQRAALDGVSFPDRTVVIRDELRHDKKRDAFGAGWRVGQACQHDVNDVLGKVVFTGRNKGFRAGNAKGAVGSLFSPGLQEAEIGAAMRLGQAHGACPATADQRLHEDRLLFL